MCSDGTEYSLSAPGGSAGRGAALFGGRWCLPGAASLVRNAGGISSAVNTTLTVSVLTGETEAMPGGEECEQCRTWVSVWAWQDREEQRELSERSTAEQDFTLQSSCSFCERTQAAEHGLGTPQLLL